MLFTIGESDPWIPIAYPGNDEKGGFYTHTHTEEVSRKGAQDD